MNRCLPLASAIVVTLGVPASHGSVCSQDKAGKVAVQKELKRLEGTWQCRWVGRNGQKFEARDDPVTIKGTKWYVG
jgi:hypothetical protein